MELELKLTCTLYLASTKVHVWAGISKQRRTGICIFEGIMNRELFVSILEGTLLPFIKAVYPESHKFMIDNDPKHTSGYATDMVVRKLSKLVENPCRVPRSQPN